MKKILVSFASLAVISSSIMTTTAWAKNKQHIQTKDPNHQLGRYKSYSDLNFGNFQSVMHPFDFQALDPTIADVNINQNNLIQSDVYKSIAEYLDERLYNFNLNIFDFTAVLANSIYQNTLNTNFAIINQNTGKAWIPPTLKSGQYECYNLQLVNLIDHTSFTFSLNYCNFNLNTTIAPIGDSLPNCTNQVHEIYSSGGHIWPPDDLSTPTIDLSTYLQNINDSSIKWEDVRGSKWKDYLLKNDNFFMNPITWNWNASVNEDDDEGGAHASVNASSESAGYNSQISYANVQSHNGLSPEGSSFGPSSPSFWNPNSFSNVETFNYGSLVEDGSSGYPDYSQVNNVWDSDATYNGNACETTLLYIAQGYMSGNQFEFCPYEGGFSNYDDYPAGHGPWNIAWTFNTTELDTSYKNIFSQASAYPVTGLEDYSTFMTYNDPNKILKNEDTTDQINELYYLYNSSQSVTFNSNYLASVTVDNQQVPLDKPYTLNADINHKIRVEFNDPTMAEQYYGNDGNGFVNMHVVIKNGYDFTQGVNAVTWTKSKSKNISGRFNIYLNTKVEEHIKTYWPIHNPNLDFLAFLINTSKNTIWNNIINMNKIKEDIESSTKQLIGTAGYDNIQQELTTPLPTTMQQKYWDALLVKKIDSNLNISKGSVFKLNLSEHYTIRNMGPKNSQYYNPVLFTQMSYSKESYSPIGPSQETAQGIANKLQGKTIVLDPKFWVGKDITNYKEQLDNAIVSQGILTQDEVQYVSSGDLTLDQARSYPNCDFTVSKDGQTVVAHNITLNVESQDQQTFNQINNLIENYIMSKSAGQGQIQYEGPLQNPYQEGHQYIDTSIQEEMQDLINSVGEEIARVGGGTIFYNNYIKYISFDKMKIYQHENIRMHLKVGNYTKDYQVIVYWKVEDPNL